MLGTSLLTLHNERKFEIAIYSAGIVAVITAVFSLLYSFYNNITDNTELRFKGYGILYNPLLTAHVYGAFTTYWLTQFFLSNRKTSIIYFVNTSSLTILLLATGSRTPFLALGLVSIWLLLTMNKYWHGFLCLGLVLIFIFLQYIIFSHFNIWAGFSYRPEIWEYAVKQILEAPWFGHGAKTPFIMKYQEFIWYDPHNVELMVLYLGGFVGLFLWLAIYGFSLHFAWKYRSNKNVLITSTWLVFGIGSGLTESSYILTRPDERWFITWIPIILLFASLSAAQQQESKNLLVSSGVGQGKT
jgi:O-antigen ligase